VRVQARAHGPVAAEAVADPPESRA
jgi:hypothetical protein